MGAGIAEVFAKSGLQVIGMDTADSAVTRGRSLIEKSLGRAVDKGKLEATERDAILSRLTLEVGLERVGECDLIVEAAFEDAAVKSDIFRTLDQRAPQAILATNTSSLSVTDIASVVKEPSRVLGVHFFNPAPVQSLVEVIKTPQTSEATLAEVLDVLSLLGKHPIVLADRAGFVVNALLITYLNRAICLYEQGFATREEIDAAMVAAGNPMGPLTLADLIGNDVNLAIMERMYAATRDGRHAPAPLLRRVCDQGWLGRKTGRGFYVYDGSSDEPLVPVPTTSRAAELPDALLAPYLNDALQMVEEGYATESDIDTGMAEGCRMPKPFTVLAELGAQRVLEAQRRVFAETGFAGDEPCSLLVERAQQSQR